MMGFVFSSTLPLDWYFGLFIIIFVIISCIIFLNNLYVFRPTLTGNYLLIPNSSFEMDDNNIPIETAEGRNSPSCAPPTTFKSEQVICAHMEPEEISSSSSDEVDIYLEWTLIV